jgi:hypothetical protein
MIGALMLEYVHFVPGRLRLKNSELRNQRGAAEAEAYALTIPGRQKRRSESANR